MYITRCELIKFLITLNIVRYSESGLISRILSNNNGEEDIFSLADDITSEDTSVQDQSSDISDIRVSSDGVRWDASNANGSFLNKFQNLQHSTHGENKVNVFSDVNSQQNYDNSKPPRRKFLSKFGLDTDELVNQIFSEDDSKSSPDFDNHTEGSKMYSNALNRLVNNLALDIDNLVDEILAEEELKTSTTPKYNLRRSNDTSFSVNTLPFNAEEFGDLILPTRTTAATKSTISKDVPEKRPEFHDSGPYDSSDRHILRDVFNEDQKGVFSNFNKILGSTADKFLTPLKPSLIRNLASRSEAATNEDASPPRIPADGGFIQDTKDILRQWLGGANVDLSPEENNSESSDDGWEVTYDDHNVADGWFSEQEQDLVKRIFEQEWFTDSSSLFEDPVQVSKEESIDLEFACVENDLWEKFNAIGRHFYMGCEFKCDCEEQTRWRRHLVRAPWAGRCDRGSRRIRKSCRPVWGKQKNK